MKTLILAAGRFGDTMRSQIAEQREPRLDVFELAAALNADIIDYLDVDRSRPRVPGRVGQVLGPSAGVAYLGFRVRDQYDALFTTGEDIGIPLSAMLKATSARCSHTMIAHTLVPAKKRLLFRYLGLRDRVDRMLVYSTSEERNAIDALAVPAEKVQRIYYHADERFFRPDCRAVEPGLVCAAGQLLRDYDCLVEAVRGLSVRVQIAAGSPWIDRPLVPREELPANVSWGRLNRYELRELYARSAFAVVPILQNEYQTGIATILEMMAMGKCVIATRTRGQVDTIVDGQTGIYVPPGDPKALRAAIEHLQAAPDEAERIGRAARKFIEEHAGLDHFVERVVDAIRGGHAARLSAQQAAEPAPDGGVSRRP